MSREAVGKMSGKKFKEYIERKVRNTIRKNSLFSKNDRIAMAVSGGKDSTSCLYILKKLGYDVEALTIDPGIGDYTRTNLWNLRKVCDKLGINLHVFSFTEEFGKTLPEIRKHLQKKGHDFSSCMICGVLRRYLLNRHAKKLGFSCLATGHNLDDEAQSFVMNVFRNDYMLALRQGPVAGVAKSSGFVKRVKPLYNIREGEIVRYSKLKKFPVNYGNCPCSSDAYRRQYIRMLDGFEKNHPSVKNNILKFQEAMKENAKRQKNLKIGVCESCGEPSASKICKACTILRMLS